jgi:hypothetical protein
MAGTRSSPPDLADPSTQRNLSGPEATRPASSVAEGESAVFSPGDAGRPSLVARITAEEWQRLARQG